MPSPPPPPPHSMDNMANGGMTGGEYRFFSCFGKPCRTLGDLRRHERDPPAHGAIVVLHRAVQALLEACVTDTGAMDFGRSGATSLAKQVRSFAGVDRVGPSPPRPCHALRGHGRLSREDLVLLALIGVVV